MLQVNSYIIYGANGVCKINDIRKEKLCGTKQTYYVLSPIDNNSSTIFVPVDNEALVAKMKHLLKRDEIISLIEDVKDQFLPWISDNKERGEYYTILLSRGDRKEILSMIHTIYLKRSELSEQRKKLWAVDENALKRAEKIINDEFSLVLGITPDKVAGFIRETVQNAS